MKRLVIISHTEHYQWDDGRIVGFGPTVTEINHLLGLFDSIDHVAMLHKGKAPAHALPYCSERIRFVPIPALGGRGFLSKLRLIGHAWSVLKIIKQTLKTTDYFQFRGPTGIGVFVVPYLILFTHKKGWFKYAGNWKQPHAPWAYRWQRWLFIQQQRPVTLNGYWDDQPSHCLSFENPCLTDAELQEGQQTRAAKVFESTAIQLCFVGRLEAEKGIGLLIEAIQKLPLAMQQHIHTVHVVGHGKEASLYYQKAETSGLPFKFYGELPRQDVHAIYKICHAIILPSRSEGFPKVIAEAMNYGCVPIVSNVSAIHNYIKNGVNGFLLEHITYEGLIRALMHFFNLTAEVHVQLMQSGSESAPLFTYTNYNHRLLSQVLQSAT